MTDRLTRILSSLYAAQGWKFYNEDIIRLARGDSAALEELLLLGAMEARKKFIPTEDQEDVKKSATEKARRRLKEKQERKEYCRRYNIQEAEMSQHMLSVALRPINDAFKKAGAYDRAIEFLDGIMVGRKKLGDCTKSDLVKQKIKNQVGIDFLSDQNRLFAGLASLLQPGETVRACKDRVKVVEIMNQFFPAEPV